MPPPATTPVPRPVPLAQALQANDALASLRLRLQQSQARYQVAATVLPAALAAQVRPGPLDEAGWSLLASNPAVAAKLRQLVPTIEAALLDKGWQATPIRVRIQPAL